MKKRKWTIYLLTMISLVFLSCSRSEITVSIIGGSLEKRNDVIGINIHEVAESLEAARSNVESTYEAIEETLLDFDIDTESVSMLGSNSGEIEGKYFINEELQVIISKDTNMDLLLERVTLAGAAGIHSPWGIMDPNVQSADLPLGYENILAEARLKAEAIAAASGRSAGKIISIEEMNSYSDTVMFRVTYDLR
jgi:uncharacterized protein YggE